MSYIFQINRAIDYIEDNLHTPLNTESIAREAGLSKWYFQKIFHAMAGETLKDYVLRRRLSIAAHSLVKSERKVIDIALDLGFDSHEVFSRAFKRIYEMSPSEFRAVHLADISMPLKPRITSDYLSHLYRGMTMQPEFRKIEKTTAIGFVANFTPFSDNVKIIPDLWETFRENMHRIDGLSDAQRIAVIGCVAGESPSSRLEYLAGAIWEDCDDLPEGFDMRTVPAGEYAEFIHKGPVTNFPHTMNYIYGSWLPRSGRERADGPEFALYGENFNPYAPDAEVRIFIHLRYGLIWLY